MGKPDMPRAFDQTTPTAPPKYSEVGGNNEVPMQQNFQQNIPQPGSAVPFATNVGPTPMSMKCTNCHENVTTKTRTEVAPLGYIIGLVLFFCGCFCGCCLIPCCMDTFRHIHHYCPKCKVYLGTFKR